MPTLADAVDRTQNRRPELRNHTTSTGLPHESDIYQHSSTPRGESDVKDRVRVHLGFGGDELATESSRGRRDKCASRRRDIAPRVAPARGPSIRRFPAGRPAHVESQDSCAGVDCQTKISFEACRTVGPSRFSL